MAHFHNSLSPKGARAVYKDEWKTILTTISFPLIASTCRRFVYPLSYIDDAPCFTHCRGSILISAGETELSIYLSITFSCQCEKTCYQNGILTNELFIR